MNLLNVSLQATILNFHARGWSNRRIARELQIDRGTVSGYVRAAKPAIATAGSVAGAREPVSRV
jgi:transcriptional regulator